MFSTGSEAISANTCGKQLTLSTCIESKKDFIAGIKAIIPDTSFTMVQLIIVLFVLIS